MTSVLPITITIIDYGIGNLLSVRRAFEYCGAKVHLTDSAEEILKATHLVLPGVGAFEKGMAGLKEKGLIEPIKKVAAENRPFLGVCLGMQIMFDFSEEFGHFDGLGLIPGKVIAIPAIKSDGQPHKIPHIGWSGLNHPCPETVWEGTLMEGIPAESSVYFVHSYAAHPVSDSYRLSDTFYNGQRISAVVQKGNLYGCQFHPEKSGSVGLKIVSNFCRIQG